MSRAQAASTFLAWENSASRLPWAWRASSFQMEARTILPWFSSCEGHLFLMTSILRPGETRREEPSPQPSPGIPGEGAGGKSRHRSSSLSQVLMGEGRGGLIKSRLGMQISRRTSVARKLRLLSAPPALCRWTQGLTTTSELHATLFGRGMHSLTEKISPRPKRNRRRIVTSANRPTKRNTHRLSKTRFNVLSVSVSSEFSLSTQVLLDRGIWALGSL